MVDKKNFLDKETALNLYSQPEILEQLNDDELRLILQSVFFHSIRLFARDVTERWCRDKKTGQVFDSPEFNDELWENCAKPEDILCIIARDHAKTTAVAKILCLWLLLYEIEPSILFIMGKGLGEEVVGDIRRELETNYKLRFIYGQLVPIEDRSSFKTDKWRQRELQLLNNTELKALTKGEPVRGRRPTKVIIDDPQENKDVRNPEIALEFYNYIFTSVYPVLSDSGSMVVLGTIISSNCFVNMLKQEAGQKSFKVIEYPAILGMDNPEDDIVYKPETGEIKFLKGRPLWPDRWPLEKLRLRCQKMGKKRFIQEYMNVPYTSIGSPVFSTEYRYKVIEPVRTDGYGIKWYKEVPGKCQDYIAIGVDPSEGKIGGDPCGFTARNHKFELIAQYRGYVAQDILASLISPITAVFERYMVVPEKNVGLVFISEARKYTWHGQMYRKKTFDKITQREGEEYGWHTNDSTKSLMINDIDQLFRLGQYEVSPEELEEILHYHYDQKGGANAVSPYHDDLLISDMLAVQGIKRGYSEPGI